MEKIAPTMKGPRLVAKNHDKFAFKVKQIIEIALGSSI